MPPWVSNSVNFFIPLTLSTSLLYNLHWALTTLSPTGPSENLCSKLFVIAYRLGFLFFISYYFFLWAETFTMAWFSGHTDLSVSIIVQQSSSQKVQWLQTCELHKTFLPASCRNLFSSSGRVRFNGNYFAEGWFLCVIWSPQMMVKYLIPLGFGVVMNETMIWCGNR